MLNPVVGLPSPASRVAVLDGVRGVAIILVLFHHFTSMLGTSCWVDRAIARLAQAGWCGVDLFFVLSGFLITGILLRTKERTGYFANFYARRFLRIFPLYYGIICLYFFVIPRLTHGGFDLSRAPSIGWYLAYLSNLVFACKNTTVRPIFEVSWSLCIEEQFYLLWPLLIWYSTRRALVPICISILAAGPLLRMTLTLHGCSTALPYMLTPCRLDGLAMGALLAARSNSGRLGFGHWQDSVIFPIAIFAVVGFPNSRETAWGQVVIFSILAVGFGSLIAIALRLPAQSLLRRTLQSRVLLAWGRYSYAIYLFHGLIGRVLVDPLLQRWHVPTLFGSHLPVQILYWLVAFGLSFVSAWLSWNLLEKHILKLKRFFEYAPRAGAGRSVRRPPLVAVGSLPI